MLFYVESVWQHLSKLPGCINFQKLNLSRVIPFEIALIALEAQKPRWQLLIGSIRPLQITF